MLSFFVVRELRDPHAFVDLRVFRSTSFTAGNIIGIISGFGLYGLNLVIPLFYQDILGFDATQAGLALLPGALATALSMPLATRGMSALGTRRTILVGLLIFAWGAWWMGSLNQFVGFWDVFWPRTLQGFALGFIFVPLSTATLSEIPQGEMASASGIYTLIRQLGGGIGIAVLELLIQRRKDAVQSLLAGSVTFSHPAVARMVNGAANHAQAIAQLSSIVEQNATAIAYNYVFRICAFVFLATIPTLLLLRPGTSSGAVHVAVE